MSNSSLATKFIPSPHTRSRGGQKISKIVPHHAVAVASAEDVARMFQGTRIASAHYCVGNDGGIVQCVDEKYRTVTSSSMAIDSVAVTIEIANSVHAYPWPISDAAYESVIKLCVDICQRNGIPGLVFTGNNNGNLTMHRYNTATQCPGDYLAGRFPEIAAEVNKRLKDTETIEEDEDMTLDRFKELMREYRAELQDNDAAAWSEDARKWAVDSGLIKGTSDGEFVGAWEDFLTREQMATLLYRFAQMMGRA